DLLKTVPSMLNSIGNVKMDRLVYLGRLLAIPQKLFTHLAFAGLRVFLSDHFLTKLPKSDWLK
ncbi:MAG: hypothetical protein ACYSUD_04405, partial [Planctomycetota bacterium]